MGDKSKGSVVLFRLNYFDLVRDLPAAIMLSQIHYWYQPSNKDNLSKLRVKRKGQWWIAKSYKGWWDDCRLTRGQVDRVIPFLVKLKLIEVKVFRYGKGSLQHGPPPVRHIRSLGFHLHKESIIAAPYAITNSLPACKGTTTDYGTEITAEITLQKNSKDQSQEKNSTHCIPSCNQKVAVMNSQDTLAHLAAKKATLTVPAEPKNASGLALAWQKLVPHYHDLPALGDGLKIKPLVAKEVGMLAKFLKAVGKDQAYGVMHCAVRDWDRLALAVKEQKGESMPTVPRVNYLLRHWDIALGCLKKQQSLIATPHAAPNSGVKMMSEAEQKAKLLAGK